MAVVGAVPSAPNGLKPLALEMGSVNGGKVPSSIEAWRSIR